MSYAQDLSDKLARQCRDLMSSPSYARLFSTRLSAQKHATAEFETTAKGFRLSTSIGGVITGRGADIIIIDDALTGKANSLCPFPFVRGVPAD